MPPSSGPLGARVPPQAASWDIEASRKEHHWHRASHLLLQPKSPPATIGREMVRICRGLCGEGDTEDLGRLLPMLIRLSAS